MTDENEILVELKRISLMLFELVGQEKDQKERILMLSRFGYSPKDIAEILGTTANTVRVTLSKSKKKKRKASNKKES